VPPTPHVRIAIIGGGFAGIGMAITLLRRGETDFLVFERSREVGGVWRDNSYPGCACDVPSHLYSFSFAPNPAWTRTYSTQAEILDYLRRCARDFGVLPHVRFEHELRQARWDDAAQRWQLDTSAGSWTADVVVAGQGGLSEPSLPDIPGADSFAGPSFHSARWDHGVDLRGRTVAVVGTGASAIQIVPRLQREAERVVVFQRTPPWIMPHRDRPIRDWERRLYRVVPAAQRAVREVVYLGRETFVLGFTRGAMPVGERISRRHLERQVADPALRERLAPSYRMGCKRILPSNHWYPALSQPNVELVTERVAEIQPHSVRTAGGDEHRVDAIVFATGFKVTDIPIAARLRGRDGRSLADVWQGSPQAHLGTCVAGFPNLFLLTGPNTGLGHSSIVLIMEAQYGWILRALRHMAEQGVGAIEPRDEVQQRWNDEVQQRLAGTVWNTGGCSSWYLDRNGRNSTLWPGTTLAYRWRLRRFAAAEFHLHPRAAARVAAA